MEGKQATAEQGRRPFRRRENKKNFSLNKKFMSPVYPYNKQASVKATAIYMYFFFPEYKALASVHVGFCCQVQRRNPAQQRMW